MTKPLPLIPSEFLTAERCIISIFELIPLKNPNYPKQNMVLNGGLSTEEYRLKHWLKNEGAKNIKVKKSRTSSFISIAFMW